MDDNTFMLRAIELAKKGGNFVNPNPKVGAVIVKDGQIVAEGYHQIYGGSHAEIVAIENAKGVDLEGATLFVNLEPCSHFGKTPPCVDSIIEKKFGKVVIAMVDPNPLVNGKGIEKLRQNGIEVEIGVFEKEAKWINRYFIKNVKVGKPYIILKVAQSLNGAIATFDFKSKWITNENSREYGWKIRSEVDAIVVGRRTVLKDNPLLNLHEIEGKMPLRVILDSKLSLPLELNVFIDEHRSKTIVFVDENLQFTRKEENLQIAGVKILRVPSKDNLLDICKVVEKLKEEFNVSVLLIEGGSETFSYFLKHSFYDEIHFFVAPMIIPGGLNAFEGYSVDSLENAVRLKPKLIEPLDSDLHIVCINPDTESLIFG